MKKFVLLCLLSVPMSLWAQKQYALPTGDSSMDEKDKPIIEVYLPKQEVANGCAIVLCPGGAMRWLSWESDVVKMAQFLNERGIAAIGLRYHLNQGGGQAPQGQQNSGQTAAADFTFGDINGDTKIDITDLSLLAVHLIDKTNFTDKQKLSADVAYKVSFR